MGFIYSNISEKGQTTVPIEVRKMFKLEKNSKILWIPIAPGMISLAMVKHVKKGSWAKGLSGKYRNDKVDGVKMLLESRKRELILEKKKYHLTVNK